MGLHSVTRISHVVLSGCQGSGNCSLPLCPGENLRVGEHVAMSLPQIQSTSLPSSVAGQ